PPSHARIRPLAAWAPVVGTGGAVHVLGTLSDADKTVDPTTTPVGPVNIGMGARVIGGTIASSGGVIPKVVRPYASFTDGASFSNVTFATSIDMQTAAAGLGGTTTLVGNPN